MKPFLVALTIATIALSSCEMGTRSAENTALQAQTKLIDKHKNALILLLEMTQEELKEKVSAKSISLQDKNTRLKELMLRSREFDFTLDTINRAV